MSELERTITRLEALRDLFAYWLRWNKRERDAEKLASNDDTHIMVVPPHWPTRGSIQAWVDTIDSAILPLRARLDPPPSVIPSAAQTLVDMYKAGNLLTWPYMGGDLSSAIKAVEAALLTQQEAPPDGERMPRHECTFCGKTFWTTEVCGHHEEHCIGNTATKGDVRP
jgi:hypothetical protein